MAESEAAEVAPGDAPPPPASRGPSASPALGVDDLLAVLGLAVAALVVFLNFHSFDQGPKWTGVGAHGLIEAYVDGGYRWSAITAYAEAHPETAGGDLSAARRPLYILAVSALRAATGLPLVDVYGWLNLLTFAAAAITLYAIARVGAGLACGPSFFAGLWLLLIPDTLVIYQAKAHPEGLALLLNGLSVLAYRRDRRGLAALAMATASLAHGSALFLVAYFALDALLTRRVGFSAAARQTAPFLVVAALSVVFRSTLLPTGALGPLPIGTLRSAAAYVQPYGLVYLAYSYEVLWVPFACQLSVDHAAGRRGELATLLPLMLILLVLHDWYRNLVAASFFFVLPMAAQYIDACGPRGADRSVSTLLFLLITILLLKATPWDHWHALPWHYYVSVIGGILLARLLAGRGATGSP